MPDAVWFEDTADLQEQPGLLSPPSPASDETCKPCNEREMCSLNDAEFNVRYNGPRGPRVLVMHGKERRFRAACRYPGCLKRAQRKDAKTIRGGLCVSHGGGKRCYVPGCKTGAYGNTDMCIKHGGGPRCQLGEEYHRAGELLPSAVYRLTGTIRDEEGEVYPSFSGKRVCRACYKRLQF